jgi:AraC family transcriptional regulator, regulatory protein of adaptative response / methylated-DNA-[protein]-cysteine methyltransferase
VNESSVINNVAYRRIERAIGFLEANWSAQPSLKEIAAQSGLSEFHFNRLFTQWAGISPVKFSHVLTREHAKTRLLQGASVLDTAYDVGLSGPSRLHDLFVSGDAVTPGEFKQGGQDLTIHYGFVKTPFGEAVAATTTKGICALRFLSGSREVMLQEIQSEWPQAQWVRRQSEVSKAVEPLFHPQAGPLRLHLHGTNFQLKVWQALLRIPSGKLATYENIARAIDAPQAHRAVGTAVGRNPIAYLIPCHRVIRKSGIFGEYRWGASRKQVICAWEAAKAAQGN